MSSIYGLHVPFDGDGTTSNIDPSLRSAIDEEWYSREKLTHQGEAIPVVYGEMVLEGIDALTKSHGYTHKGGKWYKRSYTYREKAIFMRVFCIGENIRSAMSASLAEPRSPMFITATKTHRHYWSHEKPITPSLALMAGTIPQSARD